MNDYYKMKRLFAKDADEWIEQNKNFVGLSQEDKKNIYNEFLRFVARKYGIGKKTVDNYLEIHGVSIGGL